MATDSGEKLFAIKRDENTKSYSVTLLEPEEYNNILNTKVEEYQEISINRNSSNSIPYKDFNNASRVREYFLEYINNAVDFPEEAYKHLDEEYKKSQFETLEKYKQYVKNNEELMNLYKCANDQIENYTSNAEYVEATKAIELKWANVQEKEEYILYTAVDSYGNNYIFKIITPTEYTLTIDKRSGN